MQGALNVVVKWAVKEGLNVSPHKTTIVLEAETVQHIVCFCEALARQRYNVFGKLFAEPKDISTASVKDLVPLYKRHRVIEPVLNGVFRAAQ
jgi:hypothetical protein